MSASPTIIIPPPDTDEILVPGGLINKSACLAISSWKTIWVVPVSGQHVTIIPDSSFPAEAIEVEE